MKKKNTIIIALLNFIAYSISVFPQIFLKNKESVIVVFWIASSVIFTASFIALSITLMRKKKGFLPWLLGTLNATFLTTFLASALFVKKDSSGMWWLSLMINAIILLLLLSFYIPYAFSSEAKKGEDKNKLRYTVLFILMIFIFAAFAIAATFIGVSQIYVLLILYGFLATVLLIISFFLTKKEYLRLPSVIILVNYLIFYAVLTCGKIVEPLLLLAFFFYSTVAKSLVILIFLAVAALVARIKVRKRRESGTLVIPEKEKSDFFKTFFASERLSAHILSFIFIAFFISLYILGKSFHLTRYLFLVLAFIAPFVILIKNNSLREVTFVSSCASVLLIAADYILRFCGVLSLRDLERGVDMILYFLIFAAVYLAISVPFTLFLKSSERKLLASYEADNEVIAECEE